MNPALEFKVLSILSTALLSPLSPLVTRHLSDSGVMVCEHVLLRLGEHRGVLYRYGARRRAARVCAVPHLPHTPANTQGTNAARLQCR